MNYIMIHSATSSPSDGLLLSVVGKTRDDIDSNWSYLSRGSSLWSMKIYRMSRPRLSEKCIDFNQHQYELHHDSFSYSQSQWWLTLVCSWKNKRWYWFLLIIPLYRGLCLWSLKNYQMGRRRVTDKKCIEFNPHYYECHDYSGGVKQEMILILIDHTSL